MKPTPADLRALGRRDHALRAWMRRLAPFPGFPQRTPGARTHYDALARAIVFQQLATRAAETIHGRVCALTPGPRFPHAHELADLPDAALRGAGLSAAKLLALRDLAQRSADGRLRLTGIARRSDERIVEELVEVRGIGVWSAQMFLLFRLGRLDVLAPGDLGLQEGLRILDGLDERPGPKELAARGECWAPLRSVASWTLWRIVEHERAQAAARAKSR
jgi:3-methyladenine DNA glycosylase/8-oxoguanine DNA glycosylase